MLLRWKILSPQVFLGECKYVVREKKTFVFIIDDNSFLKYKNFFQALQVTSWNIRILFLNNIDVFKLGPRKSISRNIRNVFRGFFLFFELIKFPAER